MNNFSNRKSNFSNSGRGQGRRSGEKPKMHKATCESCGDHCKVPFKPSGSKPVYCSECFEKQGNVSQGFRNSRERGNNRSGSRGRDSYRSNSRKPSYDDKKMFPAMCDGCGNECEVPFRPTSGKPVFCNTCFKKDSNNDNKYSSRSREKSNSNNSKELKQINAKLDQILKLLTPEDEVVEDEVIEELEVEK